MLNTNQLILLVIHAATIIKTQRKTRFSAQCEKICNLHRFGLLNTTKHLDTMHEILLRVHAHRHKLADLMYDKTEDGKINEGDYIACMKFLVS